MTGPSRGPTTTAHKVACWLVLLAILLVGAEGLSFAFAKLRPGLFSQRDKVVATLGEKLDRYPEFLARAYDPVLGWDNVPGEHRIQACDGRPVTVTIRPDRSRRTPAVVGGPEVLLVGDSYTRGGLRHEASACPVARTDRSSATRSNRQLSGWILPPLVTRAIWAHVESRTGAVAWAKLASPRFPSPLIKPDVRISRIRLSDWLHLEADGRAPTWTWRSRSTPSSPNTTPSG